jgi:NADPH-dependent 2,4-dienoyl-CoA reductase/sulfur reductase-like enzyme/nitrite reductase/ring-hydroxylating ferredoxin subunit
MSSEQEGPSGPDLKAGIRAADVSDGAMLEGHVDDEAVLLARRGQEWCASGAKCSHYSGPLAEGLMVGDTVRCPWHHACFSLRTGEPLRPPALNDLPAYDVEVRDGIVRVAARRTLTSTGLRRAKGPERVVIVGAGAAGNVAAETLRREGYAGPITIIDPDPDAPYDRPNLSKDYLAGNAPEEWIPLHPPDFYRDMGIELRHGARVTSLDPRGRRVRLDDGSDLDYGALLLATGAAPVRLDPDVASGGTQLHYLRSLADSRRIVAEAREGGRAVVIGASFIGLEVAASLKTRGLEVHVVAPEARPLERVMGERLGDVIRALHEEKGVHFHLENTVSSFEAGRATLKDGTVLQADFAVAGVGVRPRTQLAEAAGLELDKGVVVNRHLETKAPGIFAAGDIARWPDRYSGGAIRVEHWVVATRQGQTAARNMLGEAEEFTSAPFFWSQHYDVSINYVGHAEGWDELGVEGDLAAKDGLVRFKRAGRTLAVASLFRDLESLKAEVAMEEA